MKFTGFNIVLLLMRISVVLFLGLLVCLNAAGQGIDTSGSTTFCAGGSVVLTVNPVGSITGYQWIRGGLDTLVGATSVSYTATSSGSYTVRLKRGALPDTVVGPVVITVNPKPTVSVNSPSVCFGQPATLTASGANTYAWSPASGLNPTTGSPVIANTPVTTTYTVTGTNLATGCTNTAIATVTVNPNPSADFTFTSNACSGTNVLFTSVITGGTPGYSYAWDFGDGFTSNTANTSHAFTSLGCGTHDFNVSLTVTDSKGCQNTTISKTVTVKQAPDVRVTDTQSPGTPFSNCGNDPSVSNPNYTISVGNASPDSTCISTYSIDWGDGLIENNVIFPAIHTYTRLGAFNLKVSGLGSNGCSNTKTYTVANQKNPDIGIGTFGLTEGCVDLPINIVLSLWASNSPGTTYLLQYGDGTSTPFTHPINPAYTNDTIVHTYKNTSCPNMPVYNITITATNACRTKSFIGGDIVIKIKPQTDFTINTPISCIGQSVCFTNSTKSGYDVNCNTFGTTVWDFGDPSSGSSNSSTQSNPCHTYASPGVYTVTLTTTNVCGPSSVSKTVCITAPPAPAFTLSDTIGCVPFATIATNTTNTFNSCQNPGFKWTVTYTPSFCGTSSAFTFTNGTSDTSANPSFSFNNPGTYTITQNVTNACGTFSTSKIITVRDKLVASIIAPPNACINEAISPRPSFNCYSGPASYAWSFPGGSPATSNDSIPGPVTYNLANNYTISLSITNGCGTTTTTKPIVINTVTPASAGPSQNICGSIVTMAANTPAIGTGQWTMTSGPNSVTINNSSSPVTTITGLITGTYIFRWTITNQTCISSSDVTIIISPGASQAVAGPDQNLCLNTSTNLNAAAPLTGTGNWSQLSGPNTAIFATPSSGDTATVTGLIPGVYVFRRTVSFSNCLPTTDDVQVTVYDNPSVALAGPDQTICAAATSLAGNIPVAGNGTWSQVGTLPNAANIANPASPSTSISGLLPVNYKFIWTIANGSCVSTRDTVEINVTEVATAANAGADIQACVGSPVNLSGNTPVVGSGEWTTVSGPAGAVITDSSLPATGVTGLIPGTYIFHWTITNGNCPPNSDNVQVIIYDNPSAANAGPDQIICAAATFLAANTPAIGNGSWSQVGNLPNAANIADVTSPSTTISGLIPGAYKFKWTITNGPCISTLDTVEISVTQVATTANAGTDIRVCAVSAITLSGNTAIVGTGKWTMVSGPAGAVITDKLSNNTSVTGLVPGTYIFRWTITNGNCPPSTDDVQVIVDENVTAAVAGPSQNICGTSVTMAANMPTVGAGLWSYLSGPAGAVINTPGSPTTVISSLVPGTYVFRWLITNGSCSSNSDVTIIISPGASIANAGADQELCLLTSTSLSGNTPSIGTGVWSYLGGPLGSSITSPNTPSTAVTGLVPGTYTFSWTISFSNCAANSDDIQVIVYDNPSASAAGPDQIICAAASAFAANSPLVGNGTWSQLSGPNTANISNLTSPVSAVSSLVPGIYRFKWTIANGPCITKQDTVEINVSAIATTANAGPDQTYCNLPVINLLANVPQTGTGLWSNVNGPTAPLITIPGANSTTATGLVPGTYTFRWTITNGVCPPSTDDVTIVILDSLQNNITTSIDTICEGQSINIIGVPPSGGNGIYNYQWQQSADGSTWTDINGESNKDFSGILNVIMYFRRKVTSLPCENFSNVIKIIVQPGISNNSISPNDSICINTRAQMITGSTPTGGDGNYSYQWQQSTDGGVVWNNIPGENGINYDPGVLILTTQYRRLVNTLLCNGPQSNISNVLTITINQDSRAEFTGSPAVSCAPFLLNPVINLNTYPDRNLLYNWYADGNLFGSNITGIFPGYTITNPGDTVIIKLVTTNRFGCKPDSTQQQFVTVRTSVAHFAKDTAGGCSPLNVTFTNTSDIINNNIQFYWNFGNGITSIQAQPGTITFLQSPFFTDTTYQVTLKAYNGCDTTIWRDSVKVRSNPKARFGVDTTSGCSPFTIHITNNSLGGPNTYYWDFGNGHKDTTFATGQLNYTYNIGNTVDTFPITLRAVNECGSDTQVINIRIAPNIIMPQININAGDLFGCTPHIVAFNNATIGATSFIWDYADGTIPDVTNNGQSTVVHTFNSPGIFNIAIRMTNGCSDTTVYRQVTVFAKPKADFTTDASVYCLGDTTRINNNSLNASNYSWFWGDGQSSTGPSPTHVYAAAGNYTILLRAEKTNNSGIVCSDTLVHSIIVLVKPDVRMQTNITNVNCTPFMLNATAPGIINEEVTWFISDTAVSPNDIVRSGVSVQYIFIKAGTFSIKMVGKNAAGCKDSTVTTFIVRGTPDANFTPLNMAVCKTDTTVAYLNTTVFNDNGPLSYRWLTDGVQQSTNGNFTSRYVAPANAVLPVTFTTQLIAINTVGCGDTATGILQMNPKAKAQFSINNPNTCVPFIVSLANASQYTTSYKWLLNGVPVDTVVNPTITITRSLTPYTLTLIADNIYGCGPDTFSINFTSRIKPAAAFTLNDTLGCTGVLNVVTTNQSSNASFYQWDWGDNSAGSAFTSPTHLYTVPGRYLITLVASDGVCKDTSGKLVTVSTNPIVEFSADDTLTCDTARIHFTNLTSNANSYLWSFSDGTISTDMDPVKDFAPGPLHYTVKLVAYNNAGCKDSLTKSNLIFAQEPPAADFLISPSPVITVPDYTFTFNNLALNSNKYAYQWSLGDGSFAGTRDVIHKYPDTGSYAVRLIVLDSSTGCRDTTIKIAVINGFPGYLYVPNAFYPNSLRNEFRTFKPLGKGLADYQLQIFDSWGKLLFETRALDAAGSPSVGWDGTSKGKPMQQDAYAWRIIAHFKSGKLWDGMSYDNRSGRKPGNTFGTLTLFR